MDEIQSEKINADKKEHPLENSNVVSRIFFCWLIPYFIKGLRHEYKEDDMYGPLETHKAKSLGDKLEVVWNYEVANKKNPSLWRAILKVFIIEFVLYGILYAFLELFVRLSQPLLLSHLLKYYEPNQTEVTKNEACIYSIILVLMSVLNVVCIHNYMYCVFHLGMKLRVAVCSLIYRKALRLSNSALAETTIGQMVNLLSNDVDRFDFAATHLHTLWVAPIETLIVTFLLYSYVGATGLVGTVFLLLFIPFQMYMGKKTSHYRLRIAIRTDERVRLMSEIISGIQVIKMYTWEKSFEKLIQMARMKEIREIQATSIIRAITMSCNLVLNRVAVFLCIITYVLTDNTLNALFAYTVSSFYGLLGIVVTTRFPQAVSQFAETNVSVSRIKKFLLYDELDSKALKNNADNDEESQLLSTKAIGIHLINATVKWIEGEKTLQNVTFHANPAELVAVVGTVGGGKSTLLHAILKELPIEEGSLDIHGTISYASQEPWLFGGSVRQNIVFGQGFDQERYEEVVRVCALERDLKFFPYGDKTLIGNRGVTLSGGQRARISLARAVYKEADIYLLDDPLSAVDTHVGKQLFDNCICGFLKDKCVVLVTHQLQYLKNVDKIYLLEKGNIKASGSYSELKVTESDFTKLLIDREEEEVECPEKKSNLLSNESLENIDEAPTVEKEEQGSGTVSVSVYKNYIRAGGNWIKTTLLCLVFISSQISASFTDYFISIWSNIEQWRAQEITSENKFENNADTNYTFHVNQTWEPRYQSFINDLLNDKNSIIIYSCLICATMILTLSRSISFFRYCITASINLHNVMFNKIVHANIRFFNTSPSGRILNRFSKDIGAVDESLPTNAIDTIQIGLTVIAITVVIGSLNAWIFLPTIAIFLISYFIRVIFLATSRDIKRIEAITHSPIYTHLSSTLQGLTTIRALGAQAILKIEFDNYQDKYSAAYFMFLCANRAFGFWLDFQCVIYTALVAVSILFVEDEIFGGNVGLALTQSIGLMGMFQWGMKQWSELENQMTSVERIQQYIDVVPEVNENTKDPPKLWPESGEIKFVKLCLKYSPLDPYVLKEVTIEIKPKEKVGIVGRTGAGKSSLIAALFRLVQIDGTILIDNIDIRRLPLETLRSKLSIIPQEPVLFSGTLRKNLDPFDEYNDEVLWNALEEVELKKVVCELPSSLDSKMSEGGSNFSVGQRQLLCLARAVIRNHKILILDEATANVDPHTDSLIQRTIRRKFAECTVLTIAHRLHTIMESDKVLVMDAGTVVEFDHPYTLLQNPTGVFAGMVMQMGKTIGDNMVSVAEKNYKSRRNLDN